LRSKLLAVVPPSRAFLELCGMMVTGPVGLRLSDQGQLSGVDLDPDL
jgi:hypothetical protein